MTTKMTKLSAPAAIVIAAGAFFSTASIAEPLSGPRVDQAESRDSLVKRNIDGSMKRPELPIAEAALRLIDLDTTTKATVEKILAARAASIDAIVMANMDTLNGFRSDRQAAKGSKDGRGGARREHAKKLIEMFKPVLKKGPLEEQIAAVLSENSRISYLSQIDEHREKMRAQRAARGPGERGRRGGPPPMDGDGPMLFEEPMLELDAPPPQQGERRQRRQQRGGSEMGKMMSQLQGLQLEVRRSMERIHGERQARTDDFVGQLGLDAEQEAQVRNLMRQAKQQAKDSDDPRAARRESMRKIAEILTPEQQVKFREIMGRKGSPESKQRRRKAPSD